MLKLTLYKANHEIRTVDGRETDVVEYINYYGTFCTSDPLAALQMANIWIRAVEEPDFEGDDDRHYHYVRPDLRILFPDIDTVRISRIVVDHHPTTYEEEEIFAYVDIKRK